MTRIDKSKYYIDYFLRPHGGYCCEITDKKGRILFSEGYFCKSIKTQNRAKEIIDQQLEELNRKSK